MLRVSYPLTNRTVFVQLGLAFRSVCRPEFVTDFLQVYNDTLGQDVS